VSDPVDILLKDLCERTPPGKSYSQEEIAEYLGITQQRIDQIEGVALKRACRILRLMLKSQGIAVDGRSSTAEFC